MLHYQTRIEYLHNVANKRKQKEQQMYGFCGTKRNRAVIFPLAFLLACCTTLLMKSRQLVNNRDRYMFCIWNVIKQSVRCIRCVVFFSFHEIHLILMPSLRFIIGYIWPLWTRKSKNAYKKNLLKLKEHWFNVKESEVLNFSMNMAHVAVLLVQFCIHTQF